MSDLLVWFWVWLLGCAPGVVVGWLLRELPRTREEAMSNNWTHQICDACWEWRHADRDPVRLRYPETYECCFCGKKNQSGIFIRKDPRHPDLCCKDSEYHKEEVA